MISACIALYIQAKCNHFLVMYSWPERDRESLVFTSYVITYAKMHFLGTRLLQSLDKIGVFRAENPVFHVFRFLLLYYLIVEGQSSTVDWSHMEL